MNELAHRVLSRSAAIRLVCVALALGALAIWACMQGIQSYGDGLAILRAMAPDEAAAKLARDLKAFAVAMLAALLASSTLIAWYGTRSLRSGAMPPARAWIVEGQDIRTGRAASTAAWVLIACAVVLALLAAAAAALLWNLAATVQA